MTGTDDENNENTHLETWGTDFDSLNDSLRDLEKQLKTARDTLQIDSTSVGEESEMNEIFHRSRIFYSLVYVMSMHSLRRHIMRSLDTAKIKRYPRTGLAEIEKHVSNFQMRFGDVPTIHDSLINPFHFFYFQTDDTKSFESSVGNRLVTFTGKLLDTIGWNFLNDRYEVALYEVKDLDKVFQWDFDHDFLYKVGGSNSVLLELQVNGEFQLLLAYVGGEIPWNGKHGEGFPVLKVHFEGEGEIEAFYESSRAIVLKLDGLEWIEGVFRTSYLLKHWVELAKIEQDQREL